MEKEKHMRLLVWTALLAAVAVAWWSTAQTPTIVEPDMSAYENGTSESGSQSSSQTSLPAYTQDGKRIVRYYNSGFSPFITEIKKGETVHFVNLSSSPLWVTTEDHPTAKQQLLTELDFDRSISTNDSYDFLANKPGSWGFYNLNNRQHLGTLVITE